jgi:hypothetical protein
MGRPHLLVAVQKVEGSNPFSRSAGIPLQGEEGRELPRFPAESIALDERHRLLLFGAPSSGRWLPDRGLGRRSRPRRDDPEEAPEPARSEHRRERLLAGRSGCLRGPAAISLPTKIVHVGLDQILA